MGKFVKDREKSGRHVLLARSEMEKTGSRMLRMVGDIFQL